MRSDRIERAGTLDAQRGHRAPTGRSQVNAAKREPVSHEPQRILFFATRQPAACGIALQLIRYAAWDTF